MNKINEYVRLKGLKNGDRLPTERDLAGELDISRHEVRRFLSEMELQGLVWRGRRTGTVLGRSPSRPANHVERSFRAASPNDIMEARLAIEPVVATLAATKATEGDLKLIDTCMRRTIEVLNDQSWREWDSAFHLAIAEATHNEVFVAVVRGLNAARASGPWRSMRVATSNAGKKRRAIAHHRAVLAALRRRHPDDAAQAMRDHLLAVKANLFD